MSNRREFITLLAGAAAAWPLAARAQQPARIRRIGVFMPGTADDPEYQARNAAFLQGLGELGWIVGRNVRIDYRWGAGDVDRYRAIATELVALAPDAIVALGYAAVSALQKATRSVPIVFTNVIDPVGGSLVASLARPGGNTTGFSNPEFGFAAKWLELLKEIAPGVMRVAVLRDSGIASQVALFGSIQSVAPSLGVEPRPIDTRDAGDIAYAGRQRVSAAAMRRPPPRSKASATPPRTERTRCRRSAGLVSAAAVCAAMRPIQKLLMELPKFTSCGDSSVFRAPLRTGAAHIVRLGPVPARLICLVLRPSGHRGTRLDNREGESASYMREVLKHPKSSMIGIAAVQSIALDGASRHGSTSCDLGDEALVAASRRNGGASFLHSAGLDPKAVAFQHGAKRSTGGRLLRVQPDDQYAGETQEVRHPIERRLDRFDRTVPSIEENDVILPGREAALRRSRCASVTQTMQIDHGFGAVGAGHDDSRKLGAMC
jgi:hypothetical protein